MKMYLALKTNPFSFLSFGDYEQSPPYPAPEGYEWVEGELPENAYPTAPKEFIVSQELKALFDTLPIELRVSFSPIKAAVFLELQEGNIDLAYAIVRAQVVDQLYEQLQLDILNKIEELKV